MRPVQLLDAFMASRPVLLIPVWGFSAIGFRCATGAGTGSWYFQIQQSARYSDYLILSLFSCAVAAVYLMNQLADIAVDKKNGGLPLIARGIVSIRTAWFATVCFGGSAVIVPLLLGRPTISWCSAAALVLGLVYSFRPLRFSGRPFLDFLSNATGYGIIAFGAGWYTGGEQPLSEQFLSFALPYFFLMCAGSISSTLPDIEGDRTDGKNTTALFLGPMRAHLLATLLLILAGVTGFLVKDTVAVGCSVAALPFYVGYILRPGAFFMESTYKIGGGLTIMAAFFAMPYFIATSFFVFAVTWLYFRIRHGIAYPSLIPVKQQ